MSIARTLRLSRQTVYTALHSTGTSPRHPRRSATAPPAILPDDALLDLLPSEGLGLIIGPQGVGKSALAHRLAELHRGRRPVAVIGPEDLRAYLPRSVRLVPSLQDVPAGAVVVFDEAHVAVSARATMTASNRDTVHLVGFLRQRGILLLTVAHHASDLDRRLTQHASAILIKKPGTFAAMDRPVLRPLLARASRAFSRVPGDPRRLVYAVVGDREVLAEVSLPSYWSDGLSRGFAAWTPPQRAESAEQAVEPEPDQAEEAHEQAKAVRLRREREERAQTWLSRCLDDGMSVVLARLVAERARRGWSAERLKKLKGVIERLTARGVDGFGLAGFIRSGGEDLVGQLRILERALTTLRRWKTEPETAKQFLILFFQNPEEAVAVLEESEQSDPAWRAWRFAQGVRGRLSALAQAAWRRAIGEDVRQFLDLLRPRPQESPRPPRETIIVTTPTGPVEAEVLARRDGQCLVQLPAGRLLSISDPTNRGPPAPRAE